jgi:4-hydroxybenzoate polyprenyltransferase
MGSGGGGRARRALRWSSERVLAIDRLIRLHQLFFTAIWPILGAASVRRSFTVEEVGALLCVIICFLVSAAVLNDVVDLPIDRTDPLRQQDALVSGAIRPWQGLALALVQPVLTIPFTIFLGGTWTAHAWLGAAFILMAAYNLWGKRCPFPPLTDAVQGLSWASLTIYGAQSVGAAPNSLTWTVAVYVIVLTLFFNGVHGSLRDLTNDLANDARTTAIFMGARPDARNGAPRVPFSLALYASTLLALMVGICVLLVVRNDFTYSPIVWIITTVAVGAINIAAITIQPSVVRPRGSAWGAAWRMQLYLVTVVLPVAFMAYASVKLSAVLIALHMLALVLFGTTPPVVRWAWVAIRSAFWAADIERFVPRRD